MGSADEGKRVRRFYAIVKGRVQGVGFRYETQAKAQALRVGGHVRNRWDGSVEVVAQGVAGAVGDLLIWLHRGPRVARVERVQVTWQTPVAGDPDTVPRFEVRF